MINQPFRLLAFLLTVFCGQAAADANGIFFPIPAGMARLIIERADEALIVRQDALIALNGRPIGNLTRGGALRLDLAPGTWRVSASARPSAEHSILSVTLDAKHETRVRVELDPARFPAGGGIAGLSNLTRQSLDAPNDDRLPLFRLRQIIVETPEGDH